MARPGRPPLAPNDPSVRLTVRVPATQFDASWQKARDARVTLAEFVRGALRGAGAPPIPASSSRREP
jgi:hypothetical protein